MDVAPDKPRVAFHAPMKSPEHPTPSGDRRIARLTLKALRLAGFDPFEASDLRTLDMVGDAAVQAEWIAQADAEVARLVAERRPTPPSLWFSYHCYYKAPDLIGPAVARQLGIPYVISEPSISPARRDGPWSTFAERSEHAIAQADLLFWTTARDRPALEAAGHGAKMVHLPAFVGIGASPHPQARRNDEPLRLLTVAMMRTGDKVESYRRLAASLARLDLPWRLTIIGDGPEESIVRDMFDTFGTQVTFTGRIDDPAVLRSAMQEADVFVWPGVGEGVGMVYLEAQAAGLPVVAEAHPAPMELVADPCPAPENPQAFAAAIARLADPETRRSASLCARRHVSERHSIETAAQILRNSLSQLIQ